MLRRSDRRHVFLNDFLEFSDCFTGFRISESQRCLRLCVAEAESGLGMEKVVNLVKIYPDFLLPFVKAPATPNPFFGARIPKKSTPVNVKDDFNPFKHNKVVDASQVGMLGSRILLRKFGA